MADSAYQARYIAAARLLWDASQGDPQSIPQDYCEHLHHEYIDGDISLVPLISRFEYTEGLEDYEWEEAIEMLGRVNPNDWPDMGDIETVSIDDLLRTNEDDDASSMNYVEDNLGTAEKVEKVLIECISDVFGDRVSKIRSEKGYYANPKNKFLQDEDGTFAGTFEYDGNRYLFEVAPQESGWLCTYRLHHKDVDKIPPLLDEDTTDVNDYNRSVRNRGWR